jgi:cell division protein FtsZ
MPPVVGALTCRVLGLGDAGCHTIEYLAKNSPPGLTFTALNTSASSAPVTAGVDFLLVGSQTTRGLGAGGDPDQGRKAVEENLAQIQALCQGVNLVFLLTGLGGGTGTGGAPVIARAAREAGALVLAVATLPFEWEGGRRQRQALLGLQQLRAEADGVICLPNHKLMSLVHASTSLQDSFDIINDLLAQGVSGIWRILTQAGLLTLDFADLCALTRGRHSENAIAFAQASGEHRVREVWDQLQKHPLLLEGEALAQAESVLVSCVGGPDLTMADINRLMELMSRKAEMADLKLGAVIDPALTGSLRVTVLAAHTRNDSTPAGRVPLAPEPPAPAVTREEERFPTLAEAAQKTTARFVPPPLGLQERAGQMLRQQRAGGRGRKRQAQNMQGQLPLEAVSRGRFEQSEPTLHQGQDLDIPTYIRRGVPLN